MSIVLMHADACPHAVGMCAHGPWQLRFAALSPTLGLTFEFKNAGWIEKSMNA